MMRKMRAVFVVFIFFISYCRAEILTKEQMYKASLVSYSLGNSIAESDEMLKKSADLGYGTAMCEYGYRHENSGRYLSDISEVYFKKAIKQKEPCGYLPYIRRHSDSFWRMDHPDDEKDFSNFRKEFEHALDIHMSQGDIQAYWIKAKLSSGDEYITLLTHLSEKGDPSASYHMATLISEGKIGWYLFPHNRQRDAINWYRKAMMQGHTEAAIAISNLYGLSDVYNKDIYDLNDYSNLAIIWIKKGMQIGSANAISTLGYIFMQSSNKTNDPIKKLEELEFAYECYYILVSQVSDDYLENYVYDDLKELENQLSLAQIKDVKSRAGEWMKTHRAHYWPIDSTSDLYQY